MVNPSDITGAIEFGWWSGFSGVGHWIGILLGSLAILAVLFGLFQVFQYKTRVTIFPLRGDPNKDDVTLGPPKKDRGKRIKKRGIEYFRLLFSMKTIKDIPYSFQYPDGVFLLRKSRDQFEVIKRPVLGNPSVTIKTTDTALQLWDQLRGQEVSRRFTDEDWHKKQMLIFVGVIVGCLIFAGIVIWMSYATSNAQLGKVDALTNSLNGIADKIGLGGPG